MKIFGMCFIGYLYDCCKDESKGKKNKKVQCSWIRYFWQVSPSFESQECYSELGCNSYKQIKLCVLSYEAKMEVEYMPI